jgi:hypothetical protein
MKFRLFRLLTLAGAVGAFGGCYSLHTASTPELAACSLAAEDGQILEHVFIQNSGWFLFERLPLICGNVDEQSPWPWTFFANETDLAAVEAQLAAHAQKMNACVVQENVINAATTLMSIPGSNVAFSVPYLICRRETQISAVLMRRNGEEVR